MKLLFVVNGGVSSAMGLRARGLGKWLPESWDIRYEYRPETSKLRGALFFFESIRSFRPDFVYVLDMAVAGVAGALVARFSRSFRFVIDSGDAITALARSAGLRGPAGIAATWVLEETGIRTADRLVVRGSYHKELLARRGVSSTWIPDGFDHEWFYPPPHAPRPQEHFTIGLLGSVVRGQNIQGTYGWDLVETLQRLPHLPLRGLLVGSGTGLAELQEYARMRGVFERIEFAGHVAYEQLREWIWRMDVCLSTQTNDLPGQVRTTGKLPLYLACGRFILASRVGEAARILPPEMLLPYEGSRDPSYPDKLARRIQELFCSGFPGTDPNLHLLEQAHIFDYRRLGRVLTELIESLRDKP